VLAAVDLMVPGDGVPMHHRAGQAVVTPQKRLADPDQILLLLAQGNARADAGMHEQQPAADSGVGQRREPVAVLPQHWQQLWIAAANDGPDPILNRDVLNRDVVNRDIGQPRAGALLLTSHQRVAERPNPMNFREDNPAADVPHDTEWALAACDNLKIREKVSRETSRRRMALCTGDIHAGCSRWYPPLNS
jgi:hypothetical protein